MGFLSHGGDEPTHAKQPWERWGPMGARNANEAKQADDRTSPETIPTHSMVNTERIGERQNGGWYVIQVTAGKELALCQSIRRVVGEDLLKECFTPRFVTEKKVRGVWERTESLMLPGYIIAVTSNPTQLYERLRQVHEFTRLLRMGGEFCPLAEEERAWLAAFTEDGDRVIPMSMGVMEGDRVVVQRGPLKGREACIVSVNRRKSLAFIELDMCGRRVKTRIGLGIVRKRQCQGELKTT